MKIKLIIPILILMGLTLHGQEKEIIESLKKARDSKLAAVINANGIGNIGSFAAINSQSGELSAAIHLESGEDVWNFKVGAQGSNGVALFTQNGTPTGGFSGEVMYHSRIKKWEKPLARSAAARQRIWEKYEKKEALAEKRLELLEILSDADKYKKHIRQIEEQIEELNDEKEGEIEKKRALKKSLEEAVSLRDSILNDPLKYDFEMLKLEESERNIPIYRNRELASLNLERFDLMWFSIGGAWQTKDFKHFRPDDSESVILEKDAVTTDLRLSLSRHYYNNIDKKQWYWSAAAILGIGHNLEELEGLTLVQRDTQVTSGIGEKVTETEVFLGDFDERVLRFKLLFDYYRFFSLSENQDAALHFQPSLDLSDLDDPLAILEAGILFPFKSKDQKSIVNLELFYRIDDLSSARDNSAFGMRVVVPISFYNL